jgi:hypothetical protein
VDQARDDTATLDHSREINRLIGVVQRWSWAAGLVSPMGVHVEEESGLKPGLSSTVLVHVGDA